MHGVGVPGSQSCLVAHGGMGEEAYPGRRRGHIGDGQDVEENPVQASTAGEDGSANDGRRYPAQAASAGDR
jgi:hypothetical protein